MLSIPTRLSYLQQNQQIRNSLAKQNLLPEQVGELRCYPHLQAALVELFAGTAFFLSHKKKVILIDGVSWVSQTCQAQLLREGRQLINLTAEQAKDIQNFTMHLDHDVAVVLFPSENPLTGERHSFAASEAECHKKRIFSLSVFHHPHCLVNLKKLENYQSLIVDAPGMCTLGMLANRLKTPSLTEVASQGPMAVEGLCNRLASAKDQILHFESQLQHGWQPLVPADRERTFTHALIFHPEKSGEVVLSQIRKQFANSQISSLQLSLHGWTQKDLSWWRNHPDWDALRGSLVIPAGELNPDLTQCLYAS